MGPVTRRGRLASVTLDYAKLSLSKDREGGRQSRSQTDRQHNCGQEITPACQGMCFRRWLNYGLARGLVKCGLH